MKDPNLDDVKVITLSYTFYRAKSQALDKAIGDEGRAAETEQIEKAVSQSEGPAKPAAKPPEKPAS